MVVAVVTLVVTRVLDKMVALEEEATELVALLLAITKDKELQITDITVVAVL
jgi:hypothetical protein